MAILTEGGAGPGYVGHGARLDFKLLGKPAHVTVVVRQRPLGGAIRDVLTLTLYVGQEAQEVQVDARQLIAELRPLLHDDLKGGMMTMTDEPKENASKFLPRVTTTALDPTRRWFYGGVALLATAVGFAFASYDLLAFIAFIAGVVFVSPADLR